MQTVARSNPRVSNPMVSNLNAVIAFLSLLSAAGRAFERLHEARGEIFMTLGTRPLPTLQ